MDADPVVFGARAFHVAFNAAEAVIWEIAAVVVFLRRRQLVGSARLVAAVASVALVVFGVTDVWEIWTGSWRTPVALLALNVACVATLVSCLVFYYRSRWRATRPRGDSPPDFEIGP